MSERYVSMVRDRPAETFRLTPEDIDETLRSRKLLLMVLASEADDTGRVTYGPGIVSHRALMTTDELENFLIDLEELRLASGTRDATHGVVIKVMPS